MKKKWIICLAATVCLLLAWWFYSRPMPMSQLYPMLNLDKCTQLRGYYRIGSGDMEEFSAKTGSEEFEELCDLFFDRTYCRTLRDILPGGTRIHRTQPDDFQWEVLFRFDDIRFADGSGSAEVHFDFWYGELDIYFMGETYSCRTHDQEAWSEEVLKILQ